MTIDTSVGFAGVLHRLALGVELVDARTQRVGADGVLVGREVDPRLSVMAAYPDGAGPTDLNGASWPCVRFRDIGPGRHVLDHHRPLPKEITVRIVDPARRFAPRRLHIPLWSLKEVSAVEKSPPGTHVPAASRRIRPWLLPGTAAQLPRAVTSIRGRVTRSGVPVRWPRVVAYRQPNVRVGYAHGDERGEFLLVIGETGDLFPPPNRLTVRLVAIGPGEAPPPPTSADRYVDLPVERLARTAAPPPSTDLQEPILRGLALPPGYVTSTESLVVGARVGRPYTARDPVPFVA